MTTPSHSTTGAAAPHYTARMRKLMTSLRRDARDRKLPVAIVQIARVIGAWWNEPVAVWNSVQEQQRKLPTLIPHLATVPAIDLSLDDGIHIGGRGHYVLGRRLARAMQALRSGRRAGPLPLALKKISVETERGAAVVVAEFDKGEQAVAELVLGGAFDQAGGEQFVDAADLRPKEDGRQGGRGGNRVASEGGESQAGILIGHLRRGDGQADRRATIRTWSRNG